MERPFILHMLTPGAQVSPFDVNMAVDAGWQVVTPYCHVTLDGVAGLTQDAIFSRGPKGARDRKSTRLNSSHITPSRMPSSA